MTHKEEVKLNRFLTKCQAMEDIALCMLGDNGRWHDGTGKEKGSEEAVIMKTLKDMCREGESPLECLQRLVRDSVKMAG